MNIVSEIYQDQEVAPDWEHMLGKPPRAACMKNRNRIDIYLNELHSREGAMLPLRDILLSTAEEWMIRMDKDPELKEKIVRETIVRAEERLHEFEGASDAGKSIEKIMREVGIEYWKNDFYALLEGCSARLLASAKKMNRDPNSGEDLYQDAVLKGLENFWQFSGGSFYSWMFKIMQRLLIDQKRKDKTNEHAGDPEILNFVPSPGASTEDIAILRECMKGLEDIDRVIVISKLVHGRRYEDILEELQRREFTRLDSVSSVTTRFHRAMEQLKRCVR